MGWWWGDSTSLGVVGRVLILIGMPIALLADGLSALGLAIWVIGLAVVCLGYRRRAGVWQDSDSDS
jgi:hypothetical protein